MYRLTLRKKQKSTVSIVIGTAVMFWGEYVSAIESVESEARFRFRIDKFCVASALNELSGIMGRSLIFSKVVVEGVQMNALQGNTRWVQLWKSYFPNLGFSPHSHFKM